MARIQAEDLFEVKVEIIQQMADLDPTGDWMGRGARALENPHTATPRGKSPWKSSMPLSKRGRSTIPGLFVLSKQGLKVRFFFRYRY